MYHGAALTHDKMLMWTMQELEKHVHSGLVIPYMELKIKLDIFKNGSTDPNKS